MAPSFTIVISLQNPHHRHHPQQVRVDESVSVALDLESGAAGGSSTMSNRHAPLEHQPHQQRVFRMNLPQQPQQHGQQQQQQQNANNNNNNNEWGDDTSFSSMLSHLLEHNPG